MLALLACALLQDAPAVDTSALPVLAGDGPGPVVGDWLVDPGPFPAAVGRSEDGTRLVLDNGLARRTWRAAADGSCVAIDDRTSGQALLRAVHPEARVVLDGLAFAVGGLVGQPNHAYLDPDWLATMTLPGDALRLVGFEVGAPVERLAWKRVRHHAPGVAWPPRGARLVLEYAMPELDASRLWARSADSGAGRGVLFRERLDALDVAGRAAWRTRVSAAHPEATVAADGVFGALRAPAHTAAFLERDLPAEARVVEVCVDWGDDPGASWGPAIAVVFERGTVKLNLRASGTAYDAGHGHFGVWDGAREDPRAGGRRDLSRDEPWSLRMRLEPDAVLAEARAGTSRWRTVARVPRGPALGAPLALRVGKLDREGGASDHAEPGPVARCRLLTVGAWGDLDDEGERRAAALAERLGAVRVRVHHELYDGVPVLAKRVEVVNGGVAPVRLDRLVTEELAVVERDSVVETREGVPLSPPTALHVESEYAMGGLSHRNAQRFGVRWKEDPDYATQVNYLRATPCLLEVGPENELRRTIPPGETFVGPTSFLLLEGSGDRTRRSLALARFYATVAPWTTENPLMMHVRYADEETVRAAIDQCADVGFEMVVLTFGSGFDMEDDRPETLARMRRYAEYARAKGVEIGGYSLLSSRRVTPDGDNCLHPVTGRPGGQTHGTCPALASDWGRSYLAKLRRFFEKTGFTLLEHDGPYPGDLDAAARPPLQHGVSDSRFVQWSLSAELYRWLRARGVYVNAPDWYVLVGTSKCAMGYREVNWSLPRAQQVVHARQNVFDGTRHKPPTMGWMFVPLTEYHGGGAAATVEPLDEHLDHYDRMLASNLGAGVQACYRGPRLYDTERTRALVAERVAWFREHRAILESPICHAASRRADGRDLDWLTHVNPRLDERAFVVVFNPTDGALARTLRLDLRYAGLQGACAVLAADGNADERAMEGSTLALDVEVPAGGWTWFAVRAPE